MAHSGNNIKPGYEGEYRSLQFVKMNVQVTVSEKLEIMEVLVLQVL